MSRSQHRTSSEPRSGDVTARTTFLDALLARPDLLERWVIALVAEEIARQRGTSTDRLRWRDWGRESHLNEDSLGTDSLARLEIVARLNEVFHLHETGVEDYLLIRPALGDWCDLVRLSLAKRRDAASLSFTFQTSGSTGRARRVSHRLDALLTEVATMAEVVGRPGRILVNVPPHHIYGCLFSILLPAITGAEVIDARDWAPGRMLTVAEPGDLCVSTPFLWSLALRSSGAIAPGVTGLTSTAPCPPDVWDGAEARLARMIEIYGATETSGIGWRQLRDDPFALMAHLTRGPEGEVLTREGDALPLQDLLTWMGPAQFRPGGRLDGAVQVAGVNVFPAKIASALETVSGVAAAFVRLSANGRLKAFIVPAEGSDQDQLRDDLRRWMDDTLAPPERPLEIRFGTELPRNTMGKLCDWS